MTVCAYTAYRFWVVGPTFDYNMSFLSFGQYLKFLSKLPYTISTNYGGYLICGMILLLGVRFSRSGMKHKGATILGFAGLFTLALAAVLPASYPLYGTIRFPGTWYRIVFIPHTVAIIACAYLAVRCTSPRVRIAMAVALLGVLAPGVEKTRRVWAEMTTNAELEGKFYLDNPDKVLLSEQEAGWFIPGIHVMYKVETPHYLHIKDLRSGDAQSPKPVWRLEGGEFVPDYWPRWHALAQ